MRATESEVSGMRASEHTLPPVTVTVSEGEGRIEVADRGERFAYELHFRGPGGPYGGVGWVEWCRQPDGSVAPIGVLTSDVMAVVSDAGRAEDVAAMTRAVALWFESAGSPQADRVAASLRAGVEAGYAGERLSIRVLQARIMQRLVDGETLVDLCERGGFRLRSGRLETSWLQRRAGFMPTRCSRTGKTRTVRTASYEVFCMIVAALDDDPADYGV